MDNDSGDDGTDELRELGWEEWEKEWSELGWRMRQEVYCKLIHILTTVKSLRINKMWLILQ